MVNLDFTDKEFSSPEEVEKYLEENEEDLNSHKKDKLKKAKRELKEQKQQKMAKRKKIATYGIVGVLGLGLAVLVLGPLVQIALAPSSGLDLEDQPMMGQENASVSVVEFGDYKCSFCAQFESQTVPQLEENYIETGDAKFYYVNYAFLDSGNGDSSETASVASECVNDQDPDQWHSFHETVLQNQGPQDEDWATEETLMDIARDSTEGLDYDSLEQCISNKETLDEVRSDTEMGRQNGVSGTPTVFVNGEQVDSSYEAISTAIDEELDSE